MALFDRQELHGIEKDLRTYISESLDSKIKIVIENRLEVWYRENINKQVDEAIKDQFSRMMIIKFGEK